MWCWCSACQTHQPSHPPSQPATRLSSTQALLTSSHQRQACGGNPKLQIEATWLMLKLRRKHDRETLFHFYVSLFPCLLFFLLLRFLPFLVVALLMLFSSVQHLFIIIIIIIILYCSYREFMCHSASSR